MADDPIEKDKSHIIRLMIVLIAAIFTVEYGIMLYFYFSGIHMDDLSIGFIDSSLLVLILFPVIYYFSYRPLIMRIRERRQIEENLLKEKNFSDTTIDSLPGAFYLIDDQGGFLRWNKNLESVSGYSHVEISRMHLPEFFVGEDRQIIEERIKEVFAEGQSTAEADLFSKDGKKTPFFFTGLRIMIDRKQCLVGMGIDITERKRSEEKLREAELRYRTLFEQSPDGVLIIDPMTSAVIEFNETAHRQLGYTREEFKGLRIFDFEAKETPEETKIHIVNVLREGKDEFETLHRTRNGELRNVLVAVQTIRLSGKEVFHCIFNDITERKQVEEAIRESERRSREMLQNIQLAGSMMDVHGNLIFCNDFLLNLTGWRREEIIGRNWFNTFIPREFRKEALQFYNQMISQGIPVQYESDILTKKGERHLISFNNVFLHDLRGNIIGTASIGEDITMRRRAEDALKDYMAKLEDMNHLKELFTDIMHHDLLNPLGVIKLATDEILNAQTLDERLHNQLLMIRRNTDKLIDMTRSANAYARLESAEKLEKSKLDLNEMLRDVVKNFRSQLEEKNMTLEYLPRARFYAMVNPIFDTVFSNLLSNAIKYSPAGKKIEVDIINEKENYRIYFKDWGYGIKEEDKPRLFTRFERVHKKGVKGTGLGLAIVKRIMEMHRGKVWIEDNPEGGSIFYVEIPK